MAKINQLKQSKSIDLSQKEASSSRLLTKSKKKDRPSLSQALLKQGKMYLLKGDPKGIEYFEMGAKFDPQNDYLFIEQGRALFEYGRLEKSDAELKLASQCFKIATRLNPQSFQSWHLWGKTLYFLGKRKKAHHYFIEALKKYEKGLPLSKGQPSEELASFYWDLGDVWHQLAEKSGEIVDDYASIQAYQKASTLHKHLPSEFWIRFANRYEIMTKKTNDTRFLVQALQCLKQGVSIKKSSSKGWFFLGKTLKNLYSYTHNNDHFCQANECFATAARLSKNHLNIHLEWARLFLESGTLFNDSQKIQMSLDLCMRLSETHRKNPTVITLCVEALALFGKNTEQLKPIHQGLQQIESLLETCKTPETFYAYGMCLYALGSYYKDLDYYYQALETFQEGLSINRTSHVLWHAMGLSTFNAALIDRDEKNYRRSLHFFEQALYLKQCRSYQINYALCLLKYGETCQEKDLIELAVAHFEEVLSFQKNSYYVHLNWLFYYACALHQLAHFSENDSHYLKALNLLGHILNLKPEFPDIHYQLASTYGHYAESNGNLDLFERSLHHFQVAYQKDPENDQIMFEWGLTLLSLGDLLENEEGEEYLKESEHKMIQAAKLGNSHAYYGLACLYSVNGDLTTSLKFLEKASAFDALPLIEEIFEDDWLENLRETREFQIFIKQLESKSRK